MNGKRFETETGLASRPPADWSALGGPGSRFLSRMICSSLSAVQARLWLALVLTVGVVSVTVLKGSSQQEPAVPVYSAADQFSVAKNPNGPWSYGYTEGLGGPITLLTVHCTSCATGGLFDGWFGPYFGIFPLVDTTQGSRLIDTLLLHPALPNFYSVVRWTAPATGRFDLLGLFLGLDNGGTDVHVLKNGISVFDGQIRAAFDTSIFDRHVYVVNGDTIDFAAGIGPDGSMNNDSTGLKATITGPTPGE